MTPRPHLPLLLLASAALCPAQSRLVDVVYGHKLGVALTMDVFQPAHPNGIGVVSIVSGGWFSNHSSINPARAKAFTDRGMTVFEVVHGSQPKFQLPEILSDVNRAVRFIRANAAKWHVDPNRLGITGGSAGGHLSLMIGAYGGPGDPAAKDPVDRESSAVQAIAVFFPPTDMLNWGKDGTKAFTLPMLRVFWPAFGITDKTPVEDLDKMARDLSPIYGVTARMPPTFIMHGDRDTLVPLQQSELLVSRLKSLGVDAELSVKPGAGHSWPKIEEDLPKLADWLERHLKKG